MADLTKSIRVGVDGGGTGCRAALSDGLGTRLALSEGGPANIATNFESAIRNVRDAISAAGQKAQLSQEDLRAAFVHIGLAGVMTDLDAARVKQALPYANCTVTDDRPTTVTGALGGKDGHLLSIGTGTIVASQRDRQFDYVGGWGFYLSDQASGAWLGHQALRKTILALDGIIPTSDLSQTLLQHFENDPNAIVAYSVTAKPGDYAKFAPLVITAADTQDAIAVELMTEGAAYLEAALRVLKYHSGGSLCITGGVGRFYASRLADEFVHNICAPLGHAVDGALQLAAQAQAQTQEVRI